MLQIGCELDLLQKPLGAEHRGQFSVQHLDRDLAVMLEILGEVYGRHATRAELALDAVAIRHGIYYGPRKVTHRDYGRAAASGKCTLNWAGRLRAGLPPASLPGNGGASAVPPCG